MFTGRIEKHHSRGTLAGRMSKLVKDCHLPWIHMSAQATFRTKKTDTSHFVRICLWSLDKAQAQAKCCVLHCPAETLWILFKSHKPRSVLPFNAHPELRQHSPWMCFTHWPVVLPAQAEREPSLTGSSVPTEAPEVQNGNGDHQAHTAEWVC